MSRLTDFIPFSRPSIGVDEEQAALEVLRSGWLTTGPVCARFEEEFAARAGAPHALAVSSATAGLHLALEAVGVRPGTRVALSPYTFAASAEVIRYLGADPLFVDVEEDSLNLSPRLLEVVLKRRRRVAAIMPIHVAGLPCRMDEIVPLAARRGIPVVEDAAHTLPTPPARRENPGAAGPGTWGDIGVFSFYATKPITTGEGGMVVTRRDELAERMRIMRLHGIDRDVWKRYTSAPASWRYEVVAPGFKYNLPDLAAAIGRVQLRRADEFWEARRRIAGAYLRGLGDLDYVRLPAEAPGHSWHLFLIRLVEEKLTIDRDRFAAELTGLGIGVSVHFIPLHMMPYYRIRYRLREDDFPASLRAFRCGLSLPIYPGLSDEEVQRVIVAVRATGDRYLR
jgi:dTDP-4-amino-4,6-dideoxygalactose transaminase